jgi:uncharacterized RDD family membrane protein YckC
MVSFLVVLVVVVVVVFPFFLPSSHWKATAPAPTILLILLVAIPWATLPSLPVFFCRPVIWKFPKESNRHLPIHRKSIGRVPE